MALPFKRLAMKPLYFVTTLFCLTIFHLNSFAQTDIARKLNTKDSLLFSAIFTSCNLPDVESIFSPAFAFYQDKGDGQRVSVTPRDEFIGNIKKRCDRSGGKMPVRRTVSNVQVFPMGDTLAMQTGMQKFYMLIPGKPDQLVEMSRFNRIWVKVNSDWMMERELDNIQFTPHEQTEAMKDAPVYKEIMRQDSILFTAFNLRDFATFQSMFSPDLEFYQDRTGFTGYAWNMENFKKHFVDSALFTRRELVEGSLEVYPLAGYGAVEIGVHRFYGLSGGQEKLEATAKFVALWQQKGDRWQITREISYDHQ
jgi:hypothetical protein